MDREAWRAAVYGVTGSQTRLTELMIYDMEQFFICLIDIRMSSLMRCPFRSHAHF